MGPAGAELSGKVKTLFIQPDLPSSVQAGLARSRSLLLLRLGLSPAAPLPKQEFTQALLHVSLQQSGGDQQSICSTSRPSFPLGCLQTACAGSQERAGSSPSPSLGSRRAVSSPGAASCPFHSPHSFFLGLQEPWQRGIGAAFPARALRVHRPAFPLPLSPSASGEAAAQLLSRGGALWFWQPRASRSSRAATAAEGPPERAREVGGEQR